MNSQDRRRARRAARTTLKKGSAPVVASAAPVEPLAAIAALARGAVEAAADPGLADDETLAARMPCADCGHAYTSHLGTSGPCTTQDCSCNGYAAVEDGDEAAAETPPVTIYQATLRFTSVDGKPVPAFDRFDDVVSYIAENPDRKLDIARFDVVSDLPLPDELAPAETMPRRTPSAVPDPAPVSAATSGPKAWTAVLAPEGQPTDDGRVFAPGSMTWRDLPLTLMGMLETQEGHDGAQVTGRIDRIWRQGNLLMGEGVFDTGEFGTEIARMVGDGTLRGLSVDIAVSEMDVLPASEVLDENGQWRDGVTKDTVEPANPLEVMLGDESERLLYVVWSGVIGAATVCPFPAFADAKIELGASLTAAASTPPYVWTLTHQAGFRVTAGTAGDVEPEAGADIEVESLTAAAAGMVPVSPPAEWFADPELDALTPINVTGDGRVYGHAAAWDVCHIGIPGICVTAPTSETDYAYFHLGEIECDDGTTIAVGHITLDTNHASRHSSRTEATAHYDNTGVVVADVIAGEDVHGVWVAGALRPDADAATVRKLRGSTISGDWRDVNGNLELVALLAVNVPGFPIPRAPVSSAVVAGGELHQVSLIAAGIHDGDRILTHVEADPTDEIRALAARVAPTQIDEIRSLAERAGA